MQLMEKPVRLQLEHILVATSSPSWSDVAVTYAFGLAREHRAKMHLAHTAQQHDAGQTLRSMIERHDFDLAVLRADHVAGEARLGTAAEELLQSARCPLLVLGPGIRPAEPLRSAPATILYATDFSPQSLAAAQHAFSWAQEHETWLTMLHVVEGVGVLTERQRDMLAAPFRKWMAELVPEELPLWCEAEQRIMFGPVASSIAAAARELRVDLIVMGLSGLDGGASAVPGRNALEVVRQAECPVLLVRDYLRPRASLELARDCGASAPVAAA